MDEAVDQADPAELESSIEDMSEGPSKRLEEVEEGEKVLKILTELKFREPNIENHTLVN